MVWLKLCITTQHYNILYDLCTISIRESPFPQSLAYKTVRYLTYQVPPGWESQKLHYYSLHQDRYYRPGMKQHFHLGKISLFHFTSFLNRDKKLTSKKVHKVSVWIFLDFILTIIDYFISIWTPFIFLITTQKKVQTECFQTENISCC